MTSATWTRTGPREWRVERSPERQRTAVDMFNTEHEPQPDYPSLWRNVTPEEMAAFYARHHRYHDPRPMTEEELLARHLRRMRDMQMSDYHRMETRNVLGSIFRAGLF